MCIDLYFNVSNTWSLQIVKVSKSNLYVRKQSSNQLVTTRDKPSVKEPSLPGAGAEKPGMKSCRRFLAGLRIRMGFNQIRPLRKNRRPLRNKNLIRIQPPKKTRSWSDQENFKDPTLEKTRLRGLTIFTFYFFRHKTRYCKKLTIFGVFKAWCSERIRIRPYF